MELSSSLVKSFAAVTDDTEEVTSKSTAYGTVVVSGGFNYVVLDGSNELTSISEGTAVQDGDRVIVTIENHVATVTSNLSAPSTGRITAAMVDEALTEGYFDVLTAQYASIEYLQANYITAKEIDSEYASFEYLSTNYLNADYILSTFASFEYVDMGYAEIEKAIITEAEIEDLIAAHAFITDADIEHLAATVAEIEEAYVTYEEVDTLVANYVNAVYEYVNLIDADVANIMNLLAGNAGVGDLQAIYLTADNVVIDSAVIEDALIGTVLADIITSNVIYTDYITIANNEGQNFLIDGATLQINDGTVIRVQIGLDADGNYNFYLFNEEGIAIWDALGLTEAGLIGNGAIIRDVAVADDANISGYKLNIDEVTQILNENGDLILDATQVTIDGETLDYRLTEITQSAVKEVINYYAIGPSYEYPPCEPGSVVYDAICGLAICGLSFVGTIGWTTRHLYAEEDGEYLWFVQKLIYADGSEGWTEPTCLTDEYVRTKTSTLITELEVVQGQISAKIWLTDIEEATNVLGDQITTISDQYSELIITVNSIDEQVASLTTTITEDFSEMYGYVSDIYIQLGDIDLMVSGFYDYVDENITGVTNLISEIDVQLGSITVSVESLDTIVNENYDYFDTLISGIEINVGSIITRVSEIEHEYGEAVKSRVAYYAISYSPEWYPTHGGTSIAICGLAICGLAICGNTGIWTEERPEAKEGEYIWISYLVTTLDDETYWEEPVLLTDDYVREELNNVNEKYSEVIVDLNSITLTVYDSDSGMAYIELISGDTVSGAEVVTNARKAFENDDSQIIISAGTITFASGTLLIYSDHFTLDENGDLLIDTNQFTLDEGGNATFGGKLVAPTGTIGGFTINGTRMYGDWKSSSDGVTYRTTMAAPSDSLTYVFAAGGDASASNYADYPFRVSKSGTLYATDAHITGAITATSGTFSGTINAASGSTIGGWTLTTGKIYSGDKSTGVAAMQAPSDSITWVFAAGGNSHDSYKTCPFRVSKAGVLYAKSMHVVDSLYVDSTDGDSIKVLNWYNTSTARFLTNVTFNGDTDIFNGEIFANDGISVTGNVSISEKLDIYDRIRFYIYGSSYADPSTSSPNVRMLNTDSAWSRLALCTGSSIRYKNVNNDLNSHDINKLFNIPVVWFKYRDDYLSSNDERYGKEIPGFIAEDWDEVMPIAVDHEIDGVTPKMWNSNIVVPLMFEMIKCNHSEIEDIEDRMDILQLEVDRLTAENEALKQELAEITAA